jgi:DNA-binding Lrp family transcriptional regulator
MAIDAATEIGLSEALVRILRYFALRPGARAGLRQLQRALGIGSASAQRDLKRLMDIGVLRRYQAGKNVQYGIVEDAPLWGALRTLIARASSPETLLREALREVPKLEAAFVFGSTTAGTARRTSDVDLFLVADDVDLRQLHRAINEAGLLLGREVNAVRYTKTDLAHRLASGARFVREALAGPKAWVAGSSDVIAPIAIAAGVPLPAEAE